jgi:hypothetical protein
MSDFEFYFNSAFPVGAAIGFTAFAVASKTQRIPIVRRPFTMLGCTLGFAIFSQLYVCFNDSVRDDVIRKKKQFVAARQRTYLGEAKSRDVQTYDLFVKDLEKQQQK